MRSLRAWFWSATGAGVIERRGVGRPFIYAQLKDAGVGKMPDHIQMVFSSCDLVQTNFRRENAFAVVVGSGENLAKRVDNATAAADKYRLRVISLNSVVIIGAIGSP